MSPVLVPKMENELFVFETKVDIGMNDNVSWYVQLEMFGFMNEAQRCERKRTGRSAAFPRRPVSLIIKTLQLAEWPDVEMISSRSCCGHSFCSVAVTRAVPLCHYLYIFRTEHINKNLDNIGYLVVKYDPSRCCPVMTYH